jgi:COMPASS component SWD3
MTHESGHTDKVMVDSATQTDEKQQYIQYLLEEAAAQHIQNVPNTKPAETLFNEQDSRIKEDIMRMILQYLHDEGYEASRMVLHDEANVKWRDHEEQQQEIKKMRKVILEGEWQEIDRLSTKSFLRNQKSFLYAVYKQQFLEYIEHHELQKVPSSYSGVN